MVERVHSCPPRRCEKSSHTVLVYYLPLHEASILVVHLSQYVPTYNSPNVIDAAQWYMYVFMFA